MKDMAITKTLKSSFDEARTKLPEALKAEGFGVLTHIDIQATLAEKLGVEFRRYEIFGACNPPLAHTALQASLLVGVLLPCNVVLYEADDGTTTISAMDPEMLMGGDAPPALQVVAKTARERLLRALGEMA